MVVEEKYPENSLKTKKGARLLTYVVASSSSRKVPYEKMYTGRRPCISERGARVMGPNAKPRMYMLNPSVATCGETSMSLAKSPATGEKLVHISNSMLRHGGYDTPMHPN